VVVLILARGGGGRADGVVPRAGKVGEGHGGPTRWLGSMVGQQRVEVGAAQPCREPGPNRGGGGRRTGGVGWHSVGRRGQTVFKLFQNSLNRFKQTSNRSNFNRSKKFLSELEFF
jgi:hypothetical protein